MDSGESVKENIIVKNFFAVYFHKNWNKKIFFIYWYLKNLKIIICLLFKKL